MKYSAVVDRSEGDQAVLEVSSNQKALLVLLKVLPAGVKEGTHLVIYLKNGLLIKARIDQKATDESQARVEGEVEDLRRHSKGIESLNQ